MTQELEKMWARKVLTPEELKQFSNLRQVLSEEQLKAFQYEWANIAYVCESFQVSHGNL